VPCRLDGPGPEAGDAHGMEPAHHATGSAGNDKEPKMSTDTIPTQILIQSNVAHSLKIESRDGDSVGSVYSFMVHKGTGKVTHAVLSLGGFLGMGRSFYPLPFALLDFDPVRDLYVVTIDRRLLEGGPSWANNAPVFDQAYADRVASYYSTGSENLSVA